MSNNNETLETLWNNNAATLIGVGDDYAEAIGRDQAVDDDGNAIFNSYAFEIGDGYEEPVRQWKFTAADVEAFARTW